MIHNWATICIILWVFCCHKRLVNSVMAHYDPLGETFVLKYGLSLLIFAIAFEPTQEGKCSFVNKPTQPNLINYEATKAQKPLEEEMNLISCCQRAADDPVQLYKQGVLFCFCNPAHLSSLDSRWSPITPDVSLQLQMSHQVLPQKGFVWINCYFAPPKKNFAGRGKMSTNSLSAGMPTRQVTQSNCSN